MKTITATRDLPDVMSAPKTIIAVGRMTSGVVDYTVHNDGDYVRLDAPSGDYIHIAKSALRGVVDSLYAVTVVDSQLERIAARFSGVGGGDE